MEDISSYLTVREAAKQLDVTEEWVRDLINMKELKAVKIGKWRIKPAELEKFIKKRCNI